jgi:hypothetical protein
MLHVNVHSLCILHWYDENWKSLQCWQQCENESHRITHIFNRKHQYFYCYFVTNIFSIVKKSLVIQQNRKKITILRGNRPQTPRPANRVIARHVDLCMHERLLDEAKGTNRLRICLWSLGHNHDNERQKPIIWPDYLQKHSDIRPITPLVRTLCGPLPIFTRCSQLSARIYGVASSSGMALASRKSSACHPFASLSSVRAWRHSPWRYTHVSGAVSSFLCH